jgi:hypothetical protein
MDRSLSDGTSYPGERRVADEETFMEAGRVPGAGGAPAVAPAGGGRPAARVRREDERAEPAETIEPPSVPDGTFVKVRPEDHPLARACEVTVYFQDYHRSSSKLGRFGKIVGIDEQAGEYLVMLDNFECLGAPMRRVEWRKIAT